MSTPSLASPPRAVLVARGKAGDHVVIDDLLSSEECDAIITRGMAQG